MKYDVTIDAEDTSTSHGLVVELVGTGKRVLDVGCSTGYLAEAITQRGNKVSGVEIDAEAGELARSHVEELVIADLETLDLVEQFGEGSFDVVIFADVLEHLRNPLGVLRNARRLLTDGGSVVISIPNVAHGAVRLALLQGRFEYRQLGLLDDTHLRFFTRATLDDLLRDAGLFPVDRRRTVSGPFATEIPLAESDFVPGVVERLSHEPESTTYQFVLRAVPIESAPGEEALIDRVVTQDNEIRQISDELGEVARHLAGTQRAPVVGVVSAIGRTPVEKLRIATLKAELIRRLDVYVVRLYTISEDFEEVGLTGETALPLLPWTAERRQRIRGEIDTLVLVGISGQQPDAQLQAVVDDLATAGCSLHLIAQDIAVDAFAPGAHKKDQKFSTVIPDPIALAVRLFPQPFLRQRLQYLQVVGQLPSHGQLLVAYLPGLNSADVDVTWKALTTVARRLDAAIVVVSDDPGSPLEAATHRSAKSAVQSCVFRSASPLDFLAILEGAALVVTDSAAALVLSASLGRPAIGLSTSSAAPTAFVDWAASHKLHVADVHSLVSVAEVAQGVDRLQMGVLAASLEGYLDELTEAIVWRSGSRLVQSVPQRLAELQDQVNVLEAANAGFRQVLARERHAIALRSGAVLRRGDSVEGLDGEASPTTLAAERLERRRAREEIQRVNEETSRLRFELDAVYATRTMRAVRPARRVYAKLRAITR